jgi:diacylglycerol kinase (ATP)
MTVDLIVNPASGPATRRLPRTHRLRFVSELLRARGATTIRATQTSGIGDGARAAREARESGSDLVVVWGGDGTLNEVASALLDSGIQLGIVPGGSGNGLARGLGLPLQVEAAVHVALQGQPRDIDTGEVSGRAFLNLAGVGFDAAVAARVNTRNLHRGLRPYVRSVFDEFRTFDTQHFRLVLDDDAAVEVDGHMVVVCNGQQYGHGARIAPAASFEDGFLDVVTVPRLTAFDLARHGWRLFNGSLATVPGVTMARARRVVLSHEVPLPIHLDGEVVGGETTRTFSIRPRSLRVLCPRT